MHSGLLVSFGKNLRYLGLKSLTKLGVSRVVLSHNPKLCYLENFRNHFDPPYKYEYRHKNTSSASDCKNDGHVCDELCAKEFGCWGPGPKMCVRCKKLSAGNECVKRCEEKEGFFTQGNKCVPCHPECRQCRGPTANDCEGSCRHVKVSVFWRALRNLPACIFISM